MFEYLATLPLTSWVLDLGSSAGSFDANLTPAHLVRVDLQTKPTDRGGEFLQADAGRMPLRNQCLDVVVANHCFEHFVNLGQALGELGRTIKPTGTVFISVPDATTLTDRIYRWLGSGVAVAMSIRLRGRANFPNSSPPPRDFPLRRRCCCIPDSPFSIAGI